jgi:hypothetical protein
MRKSRDLLCRALCARAYARVRTAIQIASAGYWKVVEYYRTRISILHHYSAAKMRWDEITVFGIRARNSPPSSLAVNIRWRDGGGGGWMGNS